MKKPIQEPFRDVSVLVPKSRLKVKEFEVRRWAAHAIK